MGVSSGDIITRDQFDDFELLVDWKMTKGNNSGIIYRATEEYDQVWQSGPEYQVLDNSAHLDGLNRLASAGACYAVIAHREVRPESICPGHLGAKASIANLRCHRAGLLGGLPTKGGFPDIVR